jgi:hypothetical protein
MYKHHIIHLIQKKVIHIEKESTYENPMLIPKLNITYQEWWRDRPYETLQQL